MHQLKQCKTEFLHTAAVSSNNLITYNSKAIKEKINQKLINFQTKTKIKNSYPLKFPLTHLSVKSQVKYNKHAEPKSVLFYYYSNR